MTGLCLALADLQAIFQHRNGSVDFLHESPCIKYHEIERWNDEYEYATKEELRMGPYGDRNAEKRRQRRKEANFLKCSSKHSSAPFKGKPLVGKLGKDKLQRFAIASQQLVD